MGWINFSTVGILVNLVPPVEINSVSPGLENLVLPGEGNESSGSTNGVPPVEIILVPPEVVPKLSYTREGK